MTVAYPAELLTAAALVEDCGHLPEKRSQDADGRERCAECERDRKRDYEARRGPRNRRAETPGSVAYPRTLKGQVRLRVVQNDDDLPELPLFRGDCADVPRPCPFVSCRYSLYLDVTSKGALRLNFPQLEPGDMPADASCALDVAERGGLWGEHVGALLNLTRERVVQIETRALRKLQHSAGELRDHLE
jgi:hypothetical protein